MSNRTKYVIADRVANADMTGWLSDSAVRIVDGKIEDVLPVGNLPSDIEGIFRGNPTRRRFADAWSSRCSLPHALFCYEGCAGVGIGGEG